MARLSPQDEFTPANGWLAYHKTQCHHHMRTQQLTHEELQRTSHPSTEGRPPRPRTIRQPRLPEDHAKIVVCPRNGLTVTRVGKALLRDATLHSVSPMAHAVTDNICVLTLTAASLLSTHLSWTTRRITAIGAATHEAVAYATPPEDTVTGAIHNMPAYDTAKNISRSLMNSRNPTILHDRRIGSTNSALIVCDDQAVPFYVHYRGTKCKCYIHKRRVEVCNAWGAVGEHTDLCPTLTNHMTSPRENHSCTPK
ncbi:hypothetical protein HPB49_004335 [Dermacentor silvarum]|uniref:Uncharacterized protein n=1 Tax=Dermacentor silvarum TaxID=543639 RepID=A0ACB8D2V4_DERSI|nr:hypothetical protein HPB49_004335 [Dermacentor silvarum]